MPCSSAPNVDERDRAAAAPLVLLHRLRDREHRDDAGGVVVRAEQLAAEVIVVRADHDDLVADLGVAAFDEADDVRGRVLLAVGERLLEAAVVAGGREAEAREALADELARRGVAVAARHAAAELGAERGTRRAPSIF